MTLAPSSSQQSFAAGMVPGIAAHLIPPNGVAYLRNYLLDDDGSIYKRSGTEAKTDVFDAAGLTLVWDGFLAGGHRTVVASTNKFGVLASDDETVIDLSATDGLDDPARPAVVNGIMYLPRLAYGGSRLTSNYNTGTVTVTEGSTTVLGAGTAWSANVDAGMLLVIGSQLVAVASVTDNTHVELSAPWPGATAAGQTYTARRTYDLPAAFHPGALRAVAGNRLLALVGDQLFFSAAGNPSTWDPTDFHRVPAGVVGTGVIGLGDRAYVFTTGGVFVAVNLAYDLTDAFGDAQQRLEQLNEDMILWDHAGLATWQNAIVAPCADGVWLLPASGPPELLSRSIRPRYQAYVVAGQRCGLAAVHNSHYVLPVLNGPAVVTETLLCRLDRAVEVRGLGRLFPWTTFQDAGGEVRAVAQRVTDPAREPVLLGAAMTGHLIDFGQFTPDGLGSDHDDSVPVAEWISRDIPTGRLNENIVKKIRARYELLSADAVATIVAFRGSDARPTGTTWGSFLWGEAVWTLTGMAGFTLLADEAPESDGRRPFPWRVNKRLRFIRMRFRCEDPAERLVFRSIEWFVRPSGRI